MAFMYPRHFPQVPVQWDETAWLPKVTEQKEEMLISHMEAEAEEAKRQQFKFHIPPLEDSFRYDPNVALDEVTEARDEADLHTEPL